jgi:hypothetical protein
MVGEFASSSLNSHLGKNLIVFCKNEGG